MPFFFHITGMQTLMLVLTFVLGIFAVLQGTLNRTIATTWGFTLTVLLNNAVLLFIALLLYAAVRYYPQYFPGDFAARSGSAGFSWYYVLPGVVGFALVIGVPFLISRVGAASFFIAIVSAQIVASLVWDSAVEGIPLNWTRAGGAALTIVGVLVTQMRN